MTHDEASAWLRTFAANVHVSDSTKIRLHEVATMLDVCAEQRAVAQGRATTKVGIAVAIGRARVKAPRCGRRTLGERCLRGPDGRCIYCGIVVLHRVLHTTHAWTSADHSGRRTDIEQCERCTTLDNEPGAGDECPLYSTP